MNAKDLKKYDLIVKIGITAPANPELPKLFADLASVDFQSAFEMWGYMMTVHSSVLSDVVISRNIETMVFEAFAKVSESKFRQLFGASAGVQKLVYTVCATAGIAGNLSYLSSLVLGSKIDAADEALKMLSSNKNTNMDFGERMKLLIDDVFATSCAKSNSKIPNLNRKQIMLLLEHTLKVKGANKALLTQRIKELG